LGNYTEGVSYVTEEEAQKALSMPGGGKRALVEGQVSIYGEMICCLMKALAESGMDDNDCDNKPNYERISRIYGSWMLTRPQDPDFSSSEGLGMMSDNTALAVVYNVVERENKKIQVSSALTRIAPLAVWC